VRAGRGAGVNPGVIAAAAVFAFFVLVQGIGAPFTKDAEPQSAEWIQSIVRDGHWLIPHDAYGYTDRKPPLFYWLSASVAKLSGGVVDEVRARLVSVIAGTILAVAVLAWTAANVGATEGWLAFLFLIGTYGFASRATEALTDMLLTFLLFAAYTAIYPLLDETETGAAGASRRKIFVGAMLGLGVLTKGPVAIVLCALAAAIFLLIERRNPLALLRERWPWQVVGIAVAIGAVWYVPAAIVGGHKIVRIIFAENFGHFMPARLGGTGESYRPFYYIAMRLAGGAIPMTLLIVPAALAFYTGEIAAEKRRAVIYQVSMPIAVLVFFSIASVKRDDYILPAIPGIAILSASVFGLSVSGWAAKLRDVVVALVVVLPILGIAFILLSGLLPHDLPEFKLQSSDAAYYAIFLGTPFVMSMIFVFGFPIGLVGVGIAIFGLVRRRALASGVGFGVIAILLSVFWTSMLRPRVATERSLKGFALIVAEHVKGGQLCVASGINYELSYYYGAAVPEMKNPGCGFVMATPREMEAMTAEERARLRMVAKSDLKWSGGAPALFEISGGAGK
jgi:4-amino-4-deoxy-L-arabinose transferase-like glycosyltransferase